MVTRRPRVLVAHAQNPFAQSVRLVLEAAGCEVASATSGAEAIRRVTDVAPDVVLLGWQLSDMGGVDALALLQPAVPDAHIVVFSLVPRPGAGPQAFAAGADDYVEIADRGALAARVTARRRLEPDRRSGHAATGPERGGVVGGGGHDRVLVVEPEPTRRDAMRRAIGRAGGTVAEAASLAQAGQLVGDGFDAMIVNHQLPDGDGLDLLARLFATNPDAHVVVCSDVPADHKSAWVVHTSTSNAEAAVSALGLGRGFTTGPILDTSPAALVRQWNQRCGTAPLGAGGVVAEQLIDVFRTLASPKRPAIPDRVVTDIVEAVPETVPVEIALQDLNCLREVVTGHIDGRAPASAAVDVMIGANRIIDATEQALLARELERLRREAETDALTGLANRRAFERALDAELVRSSRYQHPFSVVLADLDGLKRINDRDGHPTGDFTLQALAVALRRSLRASDSAYRVGGDEFVVLLPETANVAVPDAIGRIKASGAPSFSWGAATYLDDTDDPSQLVAIADRRLIQQRESRRD